METWHIHIEGQVQGVGFRPFVYQKAIQHSISGTVNNTNDGVHCIFNATPRAAKIFYKDLINSSPDLAIIIQHRMIKTNKKSFEGFTIKHSNTNHETKLLLTPDFSLCEDCRTELKNHKDRRFGYPFITCINCGPRFSIIQKLPYDRERTSMSPFSMCDACFSEYQDPANRRYYSQTNSCQNCPVSLTLIHKNGILPYDSIQELIEKTVTLWNQGKIIAMKGIGGYLLTCDANNPLAISTLRQRKRRPSKPFAVMYPGIPELQQDFPLKEVEVAMLNSSVSPILLLSASDELNDKLCFPDIAPGLKRLGVMIPYTPLYALLMNFFDKPIVATSGNITNAPIVFEDEKAANLFSIADYILDNNRDIVVPQDDSVITYSPKQAQKIIIRRSRGLAPTYVQPGLIWSSKTILAMGAMMKSSFALLHQQNTFVSQYLGDLDHFDTQQHYKKTIDHFLDIFKTTPDTILIDKHPYYPSSVYGQELAQKGNNPIVRIQHHLAHFAAVLGEHNLLEEKEQILGVIWDGIGLGDDGHIWGGEFFLYANHRFSRAVHFPYFPYLMGDKMSLEPRLSALSVSWKIPEAESLLKDKFTKVEWNIYQSIIQKDHALMTSSMGRIFDAVASLLNLSDKSTYEGQAAMVLEDLARRYFDREGLSNGIGYPIHLDKNQKIPIGILINNIIRDLHNHKSKDYIAARFLMSLVDIVKHQANQLGTQKIAFSGGVFQNSLLVDLLIDRLGDSYQLYFHRELSPNDENIAFGQLVYHNLN